MFRLGLIVNPLAGLGGPLAHKGSDDLSIDTLAGSDTPLRATQRAVVALSVLKDLPVVVFGYGGQMAEMAATMAGLPFQGVGDCPVPSTALDTIAAAQVLVAHGVDLLVFVGGDGTARDIFTAIGSVHPVLGIPAGVKMHSGVFAVSPHAAGALIAQLIAGELVDIGLAEVRDIDEAAFRAGRVQSRFYGELLVPREGRFVQQVKQAGREVEALVVDDIAADIIETMADDTLYFIGPGSTTRGIMEALGLENTLLGVDAIQGRQLLGLDLNEQAILELLSRHQGNACIVVTAIGGQGHIFGRGNQQFSPQVLTRIGLENIIVVATKSKITALQGRPLLVDTNDPQLDRAMCGYRTIITGYHDAILYPVDDVTE